MSPANAYDHFCRVMKTNAPSVLQYFTITPFHHQSVSLAPRYGASGIKDAHHSERLQIETAQFLISTLRWF